MRQGVGDGLSVLISMGVAVGWLEVGDGKVGKAGGVLVGGKTGDGGVLVAGRIIMDVIVGWLKVGGSGVGGIEVGVANMM